MKQLVLIRHAKSSWKFSSLEDMERPLNKRGERDAPDMGKRLADRGLRPDVIISSPAVRAVATAEKIAQELNYPKKRILLEPVLYGADLFEWMAVIQRMDNDWCVAVLFGHNPAITELIRHLTDNGLDNLPTCGVAYLQYSINSWSEIGSTSLESVSIDYPKNRG